MQHGRTLLRLAIPTPLRRLFDYLPPTAVDLSRLRPGVRVKVPFGRSTQIGILHSVVTQSDVPVDKLRRAQAILDAEPVLPPPLLRLLLWSADYYHHPVGEVLHHALPAWLREGREARVDGIEAWQLTLKPDTQALEGLQRAPRQRALVDWLNTHGATTAEQLNQQMTNWREPMRKLVEKGWVERREQPCLAQESFEPTPAPELNPEQAMAVQTITARRAGFE
ncbi:MAG: primosomal protein N', partial [Gammaproteobacteria bacterium]|nr:primosomal protein N' [Gammaproteobacteria bacterium]